MTVGPITIFDKSALQALSFDQAALFGQFYRMVMTPMFFVETLADLEKEVDEGKTPEQVVGGIAAKTANFTSDPNVHHLRLVVHSLLGGQMSLDGRPHVDGGRSVQRAGGRPGIVFDQSPEAKAMTRWQHNQFIELERDFAKGWRESLRRQRVRKMNVSAMFTENTKPTTLAGVKKYADLFVRHANGPAFSAALNILRVPRAPRGPILLRWLNEGSPSIADFSPYAAYVATVQLFFQLAVSLDLISGDRPSNAIDIAYLFYLPFCMVFTSSDKLHAKTAPLFLRHNQVFVPGVELKADMIALDDYFAAQPSEVLDRGLMFFELPFESDFLTTRLWKQFLPGWVERKGDSDVSLSSEKRAAFLEEIKRDMTGPETAPINIEQAQFVSIQRTYPVKMGKWRVLPQELVDRATAHEKSIRAARGIDDEGSG